MRITVLLAALSLAACGGGKPTAFHHADPPFTLDLPSGFAAKPEGKDVVGRAELHVRSEHAADDVDLTWEPVDAADADAAIASHLDSARTGRPASVREAGRGKTAGGATYVDLDLEHHTHDFHAWLYTRGQLVQCAAYGGADAVAVCQSLRP